MPLPSTGPISMADIRSELGLSGAISLGQSNVRSLAGLASGAIAMSALRGKSAAIGLASFNLSAVASGTMCGFSRGAFGSVSPTSVFGIPIRQCYIENTGGTSPIYHLMLMIDTSSASGSHMTPRSVTIGGLTIAGIFSVDMSLAYKGSASSPTGTSTFYTSSAAAFKIFGISITAQQYSQIYNAIINKTTTVVFN